MSRVRTVGDVDESLGSSVGENKSKKKKGGAAVFGLQDHTRTAERNDSQYEQNRKDGLVRFFIVFCIVLNTVTLSMDRYDQSQLRVAEITIYLTAIFMAGF